MAKHIFVTGGVVSSLGKGLTSASIGMLLEQRGLRVRMQKLDPYINVDPGTMSPYQHGEVYVLDDGSETDLDLGHYERFTHSPLTRDSNYTTGQIYLSVINKERRGEFLGKTVQVIPHITNEIKSVHRTSWPTTDVDVVITEIGGTVGDIESQPFLEAIRQFALDVGKENCLYIHLTLVPYLKAAGELKTKPTQHSVGQLRQIGIQPDILICRTERSTQPRGSREDRPVLQRADRGGDRREGQGFFDLRSAAEPGRQQARRADRRSSSACKTAEPDLDDWRELLHRLRNPEHEISIAVVGKYAEHRDAYKSIYEALDHAGIANRAQVRIGRIQSEDDRSAKGPSGCWPATTASWCPAASASAASKARSRRSATPASEGIPFFGICLGMQCAVIEFARNVCDLDGAHSTEFDKDTPHPVICLLDEQKTITDKGGTMRLGAQPTQLEPGSIAARCYGTTEISERHRHRYEFNNAIASSSPPTACDSPAPAPTARWSKSSSCPTIPGSWPCSITPSSSRSRRRRSRCSPASSARRLRDNKSRGERAAVKKSVGKEEKTPVASDRPK